MERFNPRGEFWLKMTGAQRDDMRAAAQNPVADLAHLIHQIKMGEGVIRRMLSGTTSAIKLQLRTRTYTREFGRRQS
ncbi:hypothetical protein DL766_003216 [Monosporascus sp. MC13-8B]|uniref:Uncharacterized protein n=1 Tax=Monosporascus cannonballus TaxID=155416 RepID=A0ABY0H187_9PEZI|nr:hypothetical protein DL762_006723 [Monosporascus cannonballus]RYO92519.1 hypothetical protein DL763_004648 [Monosporascus cannonballus]RYP33944.1 hypothetical protein DL766_003216 [Monosporascus sp. MC13-8B]